MKRFNIILFLLALVVLTVEAKDLRVAGIFGNNMVLQQKTTTPICYVTVVDQFFCFFYK